MGSQGVQVGQRPTVGWFSRTAGFCTGIGAGRHGTLLKQGVVVLCHALDSGRRVSDSDYSSCTDWSRTVLRVRQPDYPGHGRSRPPTHVLAQAAGALRQPKLTTARLTRPGVVQKPAHSTGLSHTKSGVGQTGAVNGGLPHTSRFASWCGAKRCWGRRFAPHLAVALGCGANVVGLLWGVGQDRGRWKAPRGSEPVVGKASAARSRLPDPARIGELIMMRHC
jgi:hypothetical protein